MAENTCWEGIDRIVRTNVGVWT